MNCSKWNSIHRGQECCSRKRQVILTAAAVRCSVLLHSRVHRRPRNRTILLNAHHPLLSTPFRPAFSRSIATNSLHAPSARIFPPCLYYQKGKRTSCEYRLQHPSHPQPQPRAHHPLCHSCTPSHKSILEYLHTQNFTEAYAALQAEANIDYTPDPKSKYSQLLEKKWTSVIRLQKKVRPNHPSHKNASHHSQSPLI